MVLIEILRSPSDGRFSAIFGPYPSGPIADGQEIFHENGIPFDTDNWPVLNFEPGRDFLTGSLSFSVTGDYHSFTNFKTFPSIIRAFFCLF